MTHSSRKRSRLCDDDRCEFMPISKRINKLHIRSGQLNSDDEGGQEGGARLFDHSNGVDPSQSNGFESRRHCNGHSEASTSSRGGPSVVGVGPTHPNHVLHSNNNNNLCNGSSSSASSSTCSSSSSSETTMDLECQTLQVLQQMQQRAEEVFRNQQQYSPDLNETENPFYYQVNEMLYQLHMLRTQRMNRSPVSHQTG